MILEHAVLNVKPGQESAFGTAIADAKALDDKGTALTPRRFGESPARAC